MPLDEVNMPGFIQHTRHVQIYALPPDNDTPLVCGYVDGFFPLGIVVVPCEGAAILHFVLWSAIQEIWEVSK